jgi:hypothetical protein
LFTYSGSSTATRNDGLRHVATYSKNGSAPAQYSVRFIR